MITLHPGEKRDIIAGVGQLIGTGAISLANQQVKILDPTGAVAIDWTGTGVTWDGTNAFLYYTFDSTVTALRTAGEYTVHLRGTIGSELYEIAIAVRLLGS